jgi:hypothetical protein
MKRLMMLTKSSGAGSNSRKTLHRMLDRKPWFALMPLARIKRELLTSVNPSTILKIPTTYRPYPLARNTASIDTRDHCATRARKSA